MASAIDSNCGTKTLVLVPFFLVTRFNALIYPGARQALFAGRQRPLTAEYGA